MAEITARRLGELVRGVFGVLLDAPDGLPASQVVKTVEQRVPPTPFEQTTYPKSPNVRRFVEGVVRQYGKTARSLRRVPLPWPPPPWTTYRRAWTAACCSPPAGAAR